MRVLVRRRPGLPGGRVSPVDQDAAAQALRELEEARKVLLAAVRKGVGREEAHEAIREHAVAVALAQRELGMEGNDLLDRLAGDPRLRLSAGDVESAIADPLSFTGAATVQVRDFLERVAEVAARYPDAARYAAEPIL